MNQIDKVFAKVMRDSMFPQKAKELLAETNKYVIELLEKQNQLLTETLEIIRKNQEDEKQKYLSVKDVSQILKMSAAHVRYLIKKGELEGIKLSKLDKGRILITRKSLNTLVENGRRSLYRSVTENHHTTHP